MEENVLQRESNSQQLTADQKERIHKNRERAHEVRERRKRSKPYGEVTNPAPVSRSRDTAAVQPTVLRNSHAGFMFDDEEDSSTLQHTYRRTEEDAAPVLPDEWMRCEECNKRFAVSYLHSKFQLNTCDNCKDSTGKHSLITKTEAKERFLLQDRDFEERNGPPLPFLLKKNPHSMKWGEMKLFLVCQVEARAYEIWGGKEGLVEEKRKKAERREKKRENKYAKEIKALRKAVKSSMNGTLAGTSHVHNFPENDETYNSDDDSWTKTCSECGYQVTFEKM